MTARTHHFDFWGEREGKYLRLLRNDVGTIKWDTLEPCSPTYIFSPQDVDLRKEYEQSPRLTDVFPISTVGVVTGQDSKTIGFTLDETQDLAQSHRLSINTVKPILYRPFDKRFIVYDSRVVTRQRAVVMQHMTRSTSLGLISARSNKSQSQDQFFCSTSLMETKCGESTTQSAIFPLYLYDQRSTLLSDQTRNSSNRRTNLSTPFVRGFALQLQMSFLADQETGADATFGPGDIFHYIYSVFHSPTYRNRYAEFLKLDFPRIPLTSDAGLFRRLCALGADLVALHLLEDDYKAASWNTSQPKGKSSLKTLITRFAGKGDAEVVKGHPKYKDGNVHINPSCYFEGVPEEVWNFHIGGYQVCEKWLKDRRGRTLSDGDINHYQRVVVALNETIRLMAEIDLVIEEYGGWPLVGSQDTLKMEAATGLPFA